jgi:hypothetical protein
MPAPLPRRGAAAVERPARGRKALMAHCAAKRLANADRSTAPGQAAP